MQEKDELFFEEFNGAHDLTLGSKNNFKKVPRKFGGIKNNIILILIYRTREELPSGSFSVL